MKLSISSDHGGFLLKEDVKNYLIDKGYDVIDEGCYSADRVDYPTYASKVSDDVYEKKADFGILICTSGIGMSICANKHKGIRAALVSDSRSAVRR